MKLDMNIKQFLLLTTVNCLWILAWDLQREALKLDMRAIIIILFEMILLAELIGLLGRCCWVVFWLSVRQHYVKAAAAVAPRFRKSLA